jgi:Fic family protein
MAWNSDELMLPLGRTRLAQGELLAKAEHLEIELYAEQLEEEVFSTAAIEGVRLDRAQIRSSVERRLGIKTAGVIHPEKHIDGLVQVLIDATQNYSRKLSVERLKGWQAALFPSGYSGIHRIIIGDWRKSTSPMQVVSGSAEREIVHFEAPPANRLEKEMSAFLSWFNSPVEEMDGIIRAAQAHLYFVTIHPFEDGNGRIARAVSDMALALDEGRSRRFYSMSARILSERAEYYDILEKTQRGNGDITQWLVWFLECMERALRAAEIQIKHAGEKARLWQGLSNTALNPRQKKVINRLSESGRDGFEGGMTNNKYRRMTKTTRETAKRDLADLMEKGVLRRNPGGGRSTSYSLVWPDRDTGQ